jgi:ubiquinone/menaquinone biosynthesis C-methylase UbiE
MNDPRAVEVSKFTQPDVAPAYFIDFLDFLDRHHDVKRLRGEIVERMQLAPGSKVLDVGCGIGGATAALADVVGPSGLAAGVDISSALIEVASRRAVNRQGLEYRVGDASAIPYPDAFFDAARSERVFLYLPDRARVIREMMRVVKPTGRLYIVDTDIDATAIYSTKQVLTRKMTSLVAAGMPNPNSARELPALARRAGLRDIKVETFGGSTPYEFLKLAVSGALLKAAEQGLVSRAEVDEWLGEQAALHSSGDFFQAWIFVLVSGSV